MFAMPRLVVVSPIIVATLLMSSISAITVSEFVIEKPASNPVGTIHRRCSKAPIVIGVLIPTFSYSLHRFVFRFLLDVTPVVRGFALAVGLQVAFFGCQPDVDSISLFLEGRQISVSAFLETD